MYYKVVCNGSIIDVGEHKVFVKKQTNDTDIRCPQSEAQGILSSDMSTIYSLSAEETYGRTVEISDITEAEYNVYKEALEKDKQVTETVYQNTLYQVDVLDYVIKAKVAEMSSVCNTTIVNGVDVELSDGTVRHFSLSTDDQLNLSTLQAEVLAGAEKIGYHFDSGDCIYFSREDMMKIMQTCQSWKMYHITYFNSLRKYIKSLRTVDDVRAIQYGCEIPEEYQTEVLKDILGGLNG